MTNAEKFIQELEAEAIRGRYMYELYVATREKANGGFIMFDPADYV